MLVRVVSARDMNGMKEIKRRIPAFKNEDEERVFWATHSPLDYFDSKKVKRASFPNLKPSLKAISIRLPEDLLNELKTLANKKDVPYPLSKSCKDISRKTNCRRTGNLE